MIAAITSCTNTSNPAVMVGAGLLARNAAAKGLTRKPWVKTSLAPGSKVVTDYLKACDLLDDLDSDRLQPRRLRLHDLHRQLGPAARRDRRRRSQKSDVVACAVLSGNRNFEGRIHPQVKMNFLASPPLVVAYAIAGNMKLDLTKDPLGMGKDGKPVYLKDVWPSTKEIHDLIAKHVTSTQFKRATRACSTATRTGKSVATPKGENFTWSDDSTYVKHPPYFEGMTLTTGTPQNIKGARVLAMLGDSVTTDHISPAGNIASTSPAAKYLESLGVTKKDFNSYGARRGNHEVMVRGTFANIRLKNLLVPGIEGGVTVHIPSGDADVDLRRVDEVPSREDTAHHPRRQGVRRGLVARLGRQGHRAARRESRDRRELRAHPPLEPDRHGRRAAAVSRRRDRGELSG